MGDRVSQFESVQADALELFKKKNQEMHLQSLVS